MDDNILLNKKISSLFMKYSLPAVVAMIITGMQGMIDGIFVGNFVNSNALASISISGPFIQLVMGVSMIISIGTQSHVSIKLGMQDNEEAEDTFQTSFRIISVVAVLISLFGFFFSENIALFLGANDVLLEGASIYIKIAALFAPPICLMYYFGFLNRILGKPETYFYGTILSLAINVSLDYLFLVKFNMGIQGAALATGIAYASAFIMVVRPVLSKNSVLSVFKGKFSKRTINHVLYNGASEGINSVSTAVIVFLFNRELMIMAGADGVAAFTAINYVGVFAILILFGISDGVGPIVSYNFGANKLDRVKHIMKIAYISNLFFGVAMFLLLFFHGKELVSMFISGNEELIKMAANGGKLYGISFIFAGFNILNSGYFTFIGKGFESVIVAASRGFVFVSIGIFVLPKLLGVSGVWLSVTFAEVVAALIGLYLLNKDKIQSIKNMIVQKYKKILKFIVYKK